MSEQQEQISQTGTEMINAGDAENVEGRVIRKLPIFTSSKGRGNVLTMLDDMNSAQQNKPRPLKDPGYTWIEAMWHVDRTKDGKTITYSGLDMIRRAYRLGKYSGQRLVYAVENRKKEMAVKRLEAEDAVADEAAGIEAAAASGSWRRSGLRAAMRDRVQVAMPPFKRALGLDKDRRRLNAPPEVNAEQVSPTIPAPRPIAKREDVLVSDRVAKAERLSLAGKTAARKEAREKGRRAQLELKSRLMSRDGDER